jgi:hypothetical protein
MRIRYVATLLATIVLVAACANSHEPVGPTDPTSGNGAPPPPPAGVGSFKALFVAAGGILPYPTDLYFNGSADGTLNIPATTIFPQRTAMNQLDGWSTTASSYFRMSQPLKNDPVVLNSSVRIIEMVMLRQSNGVYAPVAPSPLRGANPVLLPGVDYTVGVSTDIDTGGTEAEIAWLKPLNASAGVFCPPPLPGSAICGIGYVVLVTNGLLNTSDIAATPDADYLTVRTEAITELGRAAQSGSPATYVPTCPGITNATLNGVCRLTYAHLATGAQLPAPATVNPASVILSYSFTTQSTRDALVLMSQTHTAQPIAAVPTGFTTTDLLSAAAGAPTVNPACPTCADVYAGTLLVPYYLTPPSAQDPTAPLTRPWTAADASAVPGIDASSRFITRFNLVPEKKADLSIPMLLFKPNGNSPSGGVKPANGWPVVLFMHGLGGDRTNAAPIADTYAAQGFVVVAIDQVLHGITSKTNPLYAGPDNPLAALLYGAGVRERTFDVDYVNNTTGASGPDGVIDQSGRHVITIALSAPLVGRDTFRQSGSDMITLVKSLANLDLDGDAAGDVDLSRLHYAGISLGGIVGPACVCSEMKSYYLNVPGAPLPVILRTSPSFSALVNGALAAVNPLLQPNTSVYSQFFREAQAAIDGGDPSNYVRRLAQDRPVLFSKVIGDTVVPNPTNDFLINAAGATKITAAGLNPVAAGAPKFVTFLSGSHSSLLVPTANPAVTQEMQTHAASLVATGGTAIQVVDSSLLEQ